MISSSSEEDSKGSKLNGVSFEKSPHKKNSSSKDMSESELTFTRFQDRLQNATSFKKANNSDFEGAIK